MAQAQRRIPLLIAVLAIVATALFTPSPAVGSDVLPPGGTFWDDYLNVHETSIEGIAAAGITKGCNPPVSDRYCPDKNVDRGQMAAFLARAIGLQDDGITLAARFQGQVIQQRSRRLVQVVDLALALWISLGTKDEDELRITGSLAQQGSQW